VNRYLGYGSLLLLIGWLALSYSSWLPNRLQIEMPFVQYSGWFQVASVLVFLLFVIIQIWLLRSTFRLLHRRPQTDSNSVPHGFVLRVWGEIFWTALPLLLTIGLAVVGYELWASL
jgi:heme/copper-type cytochrome/quinol oxidase subunit 2